MPECQRIGSSGHSPVIGTVTEIKTSPEGEALFLWLYERYHDEVHAFCMRRVGPAATDDVVSEIFTAVWRRIDSVDPKAERAWIYGVARNLIKNQWRSRRRRQRLMDRVSWIKGDVPPQPDAITVRNAERTEVLAAVRNLSARDREILMLSGWDELSGPEIAQVLGISKSAAQQRLHRAKQRLADEVNRLRSQGEEAS